MRSTARFMLLVVGAVAVTLVLAAVISAAMSTDSSRPPVLAHQIAGHPTAGGEPLPGDDRGFPATPAPPAAAVPAAQPAADIDQDDQDELDPGDDRDRDRGDLATTTLARSSGDGHGSGGGRDGGRG